jgi:hypothetical protein
MLPKNFVEQGTRSNFFLLNANDNRIGNTYSAVQLDAQKGPRLSLSGPTVNVQFDDVKIPAAEPYGNDSAQEQRFWLKDVANANMPFMLLTLDMFHLISSPLNAYA